MKLFRNKKKKGRTGENSFTNSSRGGASNYLGQQPTFQADETMLKLVEDVLPPMAPPPLQGEGESDISLFTSTFCMQNITTKLTNSAISFWIPVGFDVYVICLQSVKNVSPLGPIFLNHLQSKGSRYQEYMHFVKSSSSTCLVTCIYVSSDLVEEKVFERKNVQKIYFELDKGALTKGARRRRQVAKTLSRKETPLAFSVSIKIFDTSLIVINTQLPSGIGSDGTEQRVQCMEKLIQFHNFQKKADHTLLLGNFNTSLSAELDDDNLRNYMVVDNSIPKWTKDRFYYLVSEFDEVNTILKEDVQGFEVFSELPVSYPPTAMRVGLFSSLGLQENSSSSLSKATVAQIYHQKFELNQLYKYEGTGLIPDYPDRIFFTSSNSALKNFKPAQNGTLEGVSLNDRVPVFTTFRVGATNVVSESTSTETKQVNIDPSEVVPMPLAVTNVAHRGGKDSTTHKLQPPEHKKTLLLMNNHGRNFGKTSVPEFALNGSNRQLNPKPRFDQDMPPPPIPATTIVGSDVDLNGDQKTVNASGADALKMAIGILSGYPKEPAVKKQSLPKKKSSVNEEPQFCGACYSKIHTSETQIRTGDRHFHERCFKCVSCDNDIVGKHFFVNEHLYCPSCYQDLFNPECLACGERIDTTRINTDKGSYHLEHFACSTCDDPLYDQNRGKVQTKDFAYKGNKLMCMKHAVDDTTCFVCTKSIGSEQGFQTLLKTGELLDIHQNCFKCSVPGCPTMIERESNGRLWFIIKEGKILCGDHGKLTCRECSKKIYQDESFSELFGSKYHKQCVPQCADCDKPLTAKDKIIMDGLTGELVCGDCIAENHFQVSNNSRSQSVLPSSMADVYQLETGDYEQRPILPKAKLKPQSKSRRQLAGSAKAKTPTSRKMTRIGTFSGFSFPPPPPMPEEGHYSSNNRAVSMSEVDTDFDSVVFDAKTTGGLGVRRPSKSTVATNMTRTGQLGDQLIQLLRQGSQPINDGNKGKWQDVNMSPPPPPPPPLDQ
eukprot:maker-scaffold_34-snap-gene-1.23-mRNA-1 protein AED:0.41 eAED:0.41 QI:92/1/0.5/1/1/1/2/0/998